MMKAMPDTLGNERTLSSSPIAKHWSTCPKGRPGRRRPPPNGRRTVAATRWARRRPVHRVARGTTVAPTPRGRVGWVPAHSTRRITAVTDDSLSSHAHEMDFAPTPEFAEQANGTADLYDRAAEDHEGFWAEQARSRVTWAKDFERTLDWDDAPFAKWFVGGELNVAYNCVDRHVEAGNGERVAIHFEAESGDTRTITYADLQREVAKAANALTELGIGKGDTVAVYMPMIPETVVHDAGLRPPGCPALGDLRRLLGRGAAHPHRRRPVQARRHDRRPVPARQARSPQARRRRGADPRQPGRARPRRQAHRHRGRVGRGSRRVVARRRRPAGRHPRGAAARQRAPALHPLHERHHREAQGDLPHERRLPHPGRLHELGRPRRPPRDRRLLVHRRRRLGHRPQLHRLRAAGQRRDPADVRGHPRHPAPGPLVGAHREVQGLDPLHGAHRHPHLHEVGRRHPGEVRPVVGARPRRRSGSRSTPRRGSGTGRTSAAARLPSSTRGGRPRPAAS